MDITRKYFCFVFPIVTLFVTHYSLAEIYKCQQPDGLLKFSDSPCADGKDETVVLLENSPLDNTAERDNIARYHQQRTQRKSARAKPQVMLVEDAHTSERNAKIMAKEHPKKKRKNKTKKRLKQTANKNQRAADGEITD